MILGLPGPRLVLPTKSKNTQVLQHERAKPKNAKNQRLGHVAIVSPLETKVYKALSGCELCFLEQNKSLASRML